ncbi:MAG: phage tail protein [Sulfurovum sp.]|nr:phage tail protein [Sulfurovum sp.]NNJ45267.1 phage tail protein [Sulfurovum sp.]
MAVSTQRPKVDPLLEMDFLVEIEGIADVGFKDWSGIKGTWASPEYREGDDPPTKTFQDGMLSFDDLTLSRGIFKDDSVIQEWFQERSRKTVDVVRLIHDRTGNRRAAVYRLYEARCTTLEMGSGDATSDDGNSMMEMTIKYEDWDILAE